MLIKIGDRIVNTDNVAFVKNGPANNTKHAIHVHFVGGNANGEPFYNDEAKALWDALTALAQEKASAPPAKQ
jgi:hypothetical protein